MTDTKISPAEFFCNFRLSLKKITKRQKMTVFLHYNCRRTLSGFVVTPYQRLWAEHSFSHILQFNICATWKRLSDSESATFTPKSCTGKSRRWAQQQRLWSIIEEAGREKRCIKRHTSLKLSARLIVCSWSGRARVQRTNNKHNMGRSRLSSQTGQFATEILLNQHVADLSTFARGCEGFIHLAGQPAAASCSCRLPVTSCLFAVRRLTGTSTWAT